MNTLLHLLCEKQEKFQLARIVLLRLSFGVVPISRINMKTKVFPVVGKKLIFLGFVLLAVLLQKLTGQDSLVSEQDQSSSAITNKGPMTSGIDYEKVLLLSKASVGNRSIKCFISRAWEENPEHPNNKFADKLNNDLLKAGINTDLDVRNLPTGGDITEYISKIKRPDSFVILIVTPYLLERNKVENSWIRKEIDLIQKRLRYENFFYIPICIGLTEEQKVQGANIMEQSIHRYLHKDFSDEKNYKDNVIDILTEKLLVDPKQRPAFVQQTEPAFVNPMGQGFRSDGTTYQSFQKYWQDQYTQHLRNYFNFARITNFCTALGTAALAALLWVFCH